LKYNNVKFVYKAKATEEYQTSVMIITKRKTRVLFCKPTSFNLLVVFILVIATTKKKKENDQCRFDETGIAEYFHPTKIKKK